MSDKSFGDHTNRNIVKNPLLSSAVTGLSIEDLTHKAVLLPVTPSLGQITRSDQQQGSQTRTLAQTDHETHVLPSGDALSTITSSNITQITNPNILGSEYNVKLEKNRDMQSVTQSKAPLKSDDDFDVNEYIARLQGSRYVSAPLHSHHKDDQNANLDATEENLEEINLNESQSPVEVQQSLTADIAQNFSQLPAVLPHVASAVFSSFSNMLSYKSREQTPDRPNVVPDHDQRSKGYDEVQFQRPDVGIPVMGMEEFRAPKEIAPPPKEPPIGGTSNFRITTKKKYAQIPGLISGDAAHTMTYNAPPQNTPFGQNIPPIGHYMPRTSQNIPSAGQQVASHGQYMPSVGQEVPSHDQNIMPAFSQNLPPISQNTPQNAPPMNQNTNIPFAQNPPPPISTSMPPTGQIITTFLNPSGAIVGDPSEADPNTENVAGPHLQYNILNPFTPESQSVTNDKPASEIRSDLFDNGGQNFFTPIENKKHTTQNIPSNPNVPGTASIIPPPPMFSNLPRRDSQSGAGKSILPPSVARRVSANQSIIKPEVSVPSFSENIFVPVTEAAHEISGHMENIFSTGTFTSAFVPGHTTVLKSDAIGHPPNSIQPSSQTNMTHRIQPEVSPASAIETFSIPSTEEKPQTSTEVPTFFTPKEILPPVAVTTKAVSSSNVSSSSPFIPTSTYPPANVNISSPFGSTALIAPTASNIGSINPPPASYLFTPGPNTQTQSAVPLSIFQPTPQNIQTTPATPFFNPLTHAESALRNTPHPITQMPPLANPEPPKPVVEPPKATGNVNFRMTKKRPQYYAGPIEGVGAISNNVKPIIPPVIPSATATEVASFQGSLFTPEQPIKPATEEYSPLNIEQSSVPFDVIRPVENVTSHAPFDISKPQEQTYGSSFDISPPQAQSYGQDYNTAFDMSRVITDTYDAPKQDFKGFGIIGSLKSKLSSIDINKIQNTVTTFFDPAYNESKVGESVAQDNTPYEHQQYGNQQHQFGQSSQERSSFDIFVPTVEHDQYSKFKHVGYDYSPNYQYYQTQEPYGLNQDQNVYSTSSYFTDPNYSTEQVHTTNPSYDNTQVHLPAPSYTQESIPEKVENISTETSNRSTHEGVINICQQQPSYKSQVKNDEVTSILAEKSEESLSFLNPSETLSHSQQKLEQDNKPMSVALSEKATENISYYNPNEFTQENPQARPQEFFDMYANCSQPTTDLYKNASSVFVSEKSQEPTFYDPNTFDFGNKQIRETQPFDAFRNDIQKNTYPSSQNLTSNASVNENSVQIEQHPTCDSALNTSKYNMVNVQSPPQQTMPLTLAPASCFFDNSQTANRSTFPRDEEIDFKSSDQALNKDDSEDVQQEQFESKNIEINKMLSDTPVPTGAKATNIDEQSKDREVDNGNIYKERNLIESLSKDDLPLLGVSTVPLFGLSTLIADRSIETSESENETKYVGSLKTTQRRQNISEDNSCVSFFESPTLEKIPKNRSIHENIAKGIPLDITGLSITDVKNVLLIEPPQEKIGAVLKRNASSNKLEIFKGDEQSSEHYKRQNDNLPSTAFQEKVNSKFDETASEVFFKHSDTIEKEEVLKLQKGTNVEHQRDDDASDLNICATCREVNSPDILGPERNHKEVEDLTTQMIENITSRVDLSNPLTVPLTESDATINERSRFDDKQCEEITHIAEDTFETLQVQSAIDLLDDKVTTNEVNDYGWTTEGAAYSAPVHVDHDYGFKLDSDAASTKENEYGFQINVKSIIPTVDDEYKFKLDTNAIGFFDNNSQFFEELPTNASDEIKAEIKHSHEEVVLPRQMSIPSAPPAEDDTKSDETGGLDVLSIEQDAKKDFPLEEEFIIEPSETDDDKIEFRERKRSSDDSTLIDTFTNRVERFKKTADHDDVFEQKGSQVYDSPHVPMASYFDTGNYAVESHYRNSLSSPTSVNNFQFSSNLISIPPGFEEEYARRLSGISLSSRENRNEPLIPDTSTQTRTTSAITYSSPPDNKENVIGFEMRKNENIEAISEFFSESTTNTDNTTIISEPLQPMSNPVIVDSVQTFPVFTEPTAQPDVIPQNVQCLPDPINFFSANVEEIKTTEPAEESFNRLASYFTMPPAQPEHSKSFFELSQSQNHYRHEAKDNDNKNKQKSFFELSQSQNHYIDNVTKGNMTDLMKDLTSPRNLEEQIVRTVNFFSVELNNEMKHNTIAEPINIKTLEENTIPIDSKTNLNNTILVENDCKDFEYLIDCKYCINNIPGINTRAFKVRTATNDNSVTKTETEMTNEKDNNSGKRATVNFEQYDAERQAQDGITVLNENRTTSEYTPVKYHWFYRVEVEEKSLWRGFSKTDSRALEDAFQSPELNEATLVATDGGRYDVNVLGRLRLAVYWKAKPTNVRRCSWFYKGTTDARYVPYTEPVADKLEEEYRHGVTTGEWHRRLSLPNSEMVIMHGPSVMVHFLHSGATDAFSTPPSLLGKRVYRNPPKINVPRDEPVAIDHLILLVHGAGEHRPYIEQTTSRPRVVRRGHEESEIEDCEPSNIDHLLLLCHGVGSACDMRFRSVEEVVEDFRSTSLQLLQSHYRNSFDSGIVSRVEILPISWHAQLHSGETGVDRRLSRVTLDSIPRLRAFTNHTVLDVLFYTSPVFHQTIIDTVCSELNRIYSMFKQRNPSFRGDVSLGGHSLGSVILYDLLCHQLPKSPQERGHEKCPSEKTYVPGTAGTGQLCDKYPQLGFAPAALYALGSPIAIFECIRGVESLGMEFALPTCKNFFNIFHPYDPIAYRIEPLINPQLQEVKPSQIPHHKGRKRMHLELKDTMLRVGTDLKQKLLESLRTTWNKWKATPLTDGQLEKVVEEEMEKEQLCEDNKDEQAAEVTPSPEALGALNSGRRVDYVLQEAPLEMINEYLFAMTSHVGYWESEDTMLLMLREIYSALGVQPDSTVPQQSMTVQRTRTLEKDEANIINETEYPSTSRGST